MDVYRSEAVLVDAAALLHIYIYMYMYSSKLADAGGPNPLGSSRYIDTFCPEDDRLPVSPDPRLAHRRENVPDGRPYTGGQSHIVLKSVGEEGHPV